MVNIGPAHKMKIDFVLEDLSEQRYPHCSHFFGTSFIGESRSVEGLKFTGGIWQSFSLIMRISSTWEFPTESLVQDKQITTAIGLPIKSLQSDSKFRLGKNTDNYFKEQNDYSEEDLIFTLSDKEFDPSKRSKKCPLRLHENYRKEQGVFAIGHRLDRCQKDSFSRTQASVVKLTIFGCVQFNTALISWIMNNTEFWSRLDV